jgi:hypothetical protein
MEGSAILIPHASLERRSYFEPSAQCGDTNEGVRGEYSGSWLAFFPAFTAGMSGDWLKLGSCIQLQQRDCFRFSRNSSRPHASLQISQRTAVNLRRKGRLCQGGRRYEIGCLRIEKVINGKCENLLATLPFRRGKGRELEMKVLSWIFVVLMIGGLCGCTVWVIVFEDFSIIYLASREVPSRVLGFSLGCRGLIPLREMNVKSNFDGNRKVQVQVQVQVHVQVGNGGSAL